MSLLRAIKSLLRELCPICKEKRRHLAAHLYVDHADEEIL